jgi:putative ABC transport system ATP-binding protein
MSAVSLRNIVKRYRRGRESVEVLHHLDLDIAAGEFVALMGPSGSGKTTLLNLIGGLDRPDEGEVVVGGERIDKLGNAGLARWRSRHVGFVFQFYNLMPTLSAERNVELPLLLTSLGRVERHRHVASCRAASSSGSPSPARWSPIRRCWCATSRPAISTARPPTRSWNCCARSIASRARPSSW